MSFLDILHLALRNLRQAKLRATLTTMGVIVGTAVIVTMVSFGLGLQGNMLERFKALDLFNEVQVFGQGLSNLVGANRQGPRDEGDRSTRRERTATRILDDAGIKEIAAIPNVLYVEPSVAFGAFIRANEKVLTQTVGGTNIPNYSARFQTFAAGRMISSPRGSDLCFLGRNEPGAHTWNVPRPRRVPRRRRSGRAPRPRHGSPRDGGQWRRARDDVGRTAQLPDSLLHPVSARHDPQADREAGGPLSVYALVRRLHRDGAELRRCPRPRHLGADRL